MAKKGKLEKNSESFLQAVKNNAIRINYGKPKIDKTLKNNKCSLCGNRDETVNQIINECSKLAQNKVWD